MESLQHLIRVKSRLMRPFPTDIPARLRPLAGIRAVAFDVYGTLLISAAGDALGEAEANDRGFIIREAVTASGIDMSPKSLFRLELELDAEIDRQRAAARSSGIDYPDPDVRDVWSAVLGDAGAAATFRQIERLSVEYELSANPTWPMPGAIACLRALHSRAALGIVSNAQFSTPLIMDEQLGPSFRNLVPQDCCLWSYQYGRAKPSKELFEIAAERFASLGISRSACLFVGNDMLNDIWAAAACGWRTALFAGDARSLRMRENDERCRNLRPDLIITALAQLPPLLR